MKVTHIGTKKIIEYNPIKNGIYKTKDSTYEFSGKRLDINSILENDIVRANGSVRIKIIVSFKTDISAQDLPVNGDCLNLSLSTDAIVVNEI